MSAAFSSLKSIDNAVGNFIVGQFSNVYMPSSRFNQSVREFLNRESNKKLFYAQVADAADFKRKLRKANRDQKTVNEPVEAGGKPDISVELKQANLPAAWFYREASLSSIPLDELPAQPNSERVTLDDETDLLLSYDTVLLTYHLAFVSHDRDALDWLARMWFQKMRRRDTRAGSFSAIASIGDLKDKITCQMRDRESVLFTELSGPQDARLFAIETTFEIAAEIVMAEEDTPETAADAQLLDPWTGEVLSTTVESE